ncbi:triose-phosphate transporter family-domain-containing protein [Pilobolus umbonatus]|nr:triose-phosphate transporter family-domain-containing protein [Pilobolus umbonatus]
MLSLFISKDHEQPSLPTRLSLPRVSLSDNSRFLLTCCLWYMSSSLSSNTGKHIMNTFRYPITLTLTQFLLVACWSSIIQHLMAKRIKYPTTTLIRTIIPLSTFMIFGHIFSSLAISKIPVSLVHTIKALAPLFTVLFYRFIFKVQYSSKVYTSLMPLMLGVILACSFTFSSNIIGLLCALISCLIFVMQNIFSKKVFMKESGLDPHKLDKLNMLFYSSILAALLMSPLWLMTDATTMVVKDEVSTLVGYFLLNGTAHFSQCYFAFTALSLSSPVSYSIASLVKRIFVIVISILWFGQQVSVVQAAGISLTFLGLWLYQKAKLEINQGEAAMILPLSDVQEKLS